MDKLTSEQIKRLEKAEKMMRESIGILRNIDVETESFQTCRYKNAYVNTEQAFRLFVDGITK
jgi:hypothetical protein